MSSSLVTERGKQAGAGLAFVAAVAVLAGCAGPTVEASSGAVNTGTYPNLNIPPDRAAEQFSTDERAAKFDDLKAAKGTQKDAAKEGPKPVDEKRLKKLAENHGEDTLKAIEGQ